MIPTFPISVKALIKKDKKFLMIRGRRDGKIEFSFPGGLIEKKESVKEALIREVKEEINISINIGKLICIKKYIHPLGSETLGIYFECKLENENFVLGSEIDKKFEAIVWVSKDEAPMWAKEIMVQLP